MQGASQFRGAAEFATKEAETQLLLPMNENAALVATLAKSDLYREYGAAYAEATGLPIAIRPLEYWHVPLHKQRKENSFCALMAARSGTCAACLQAQERLTRSAMEAPATTMCTRGLAEAAAPIRLGENTIGFLQTGQVLRAKPTEGQFAKVLHGVREAGVDTEETTLREAYFRTPVMPQKRLEAAAKMLGIFAQYLALKGNEITLQAHAAEPPLVVNAKAYIQEHHADPITLDDVAKAVHTSKFNFCKIFKKATGMTFTDYLARVRTERAKALLPDRNRRISEIAYDVGFQSLTHFNRIFRTLTGQSPTAFREQFGQA